MNCPKCGKELPQEAHFCMHCFSQIDQAQQGITNTTEKSEKKAVVFFKSKAFRSAVAGLLAVMLFCTGGILLKKWNNRVKTVQEDEVIIVTVTEESGEAVTDANGEAVTQAVVAVTEKSGEAVTDKNGSKVFRAVEAVTNANGERITDASGEQIYTVVTQASGASESETTSKRSILDWLIGDSSSDSKESSTQATAASTSAVSTTKPESTAGQPTTKPQPTTQPVTQPAAPSTTVAANANDFSYTESDGVITITKYNGNASYVTVPAYIDSKPVKYLGENVFSNKSGITAIQFEQTSETLLLEYERTVFNGLANLQYIIFPQSTAANPIHNYGNTYYKYSINKLIKDCPKLEGIYFGSKADSYNSSVGLFSESGVVMYYAQGGSEKVLAYYPRGKKDASYSIPSSVRTLDNAAITDNPYVQSVRIGKSLKNIQSGSSQWDYSNFNFLGCSALREFTVEEGNTNYVTHDGVLIAVSVGSMNGVQYYSVHYPPGKTDRYYEFPTGYNIMIMNLFKGNPYLEEVKFNGKVYWMTHLYEKTPANPPNLKKIILPADQIPSIQKRNYANAGITIETY